MEQDKFNMAKTAALGMLEDNGLYEWSVKLNNKNTTSAETHHDDKTIYLSKRFLIITDSNNFRGVMLHEIAHAMLGPGFGHGEEFMSMCSKLEVSDEFSTHGVMMGIGKYVLSCSKCGQTGTHNSPRDKYCGMCAKDGEMTKFDRKINKLELRSW